MALPLARKASFVRAPCAPVAPLGPLAPLTVVSSPPPHPMAMDPAASASVAATSNLFFTDDLLGAEPGSRHPTERAGRVPVTRARCQASARGTGRPGCGEAARAQRSA